MKTPTESTMPFDLTAEVAALPRFGSGLGLSRMLALRDAMTDDSVTAAEWLDGLDAIKITGSNGKGSTCAFLAAILDELVPSCGAYTSPHLHQASERFTLGGRAVANAQLQSAWQRVTERARRVKARHGDVFSAFEMLTATALDVFANRADALVAEAGIGGRFDPVRTIPGHLAAITSLDLEHADLLGPTLEHIALDKAAICSPGGTLVAGFLTASDNPHGTRALRSLRADARLRGVELVDLRQRVRLPGLASTTPEIGSGRRVDLDLDAPSFATHFHLEDLELGLAGPFQAHNAALAVVLAEIWAGRHLVPNGLTPESFTAAVRSGLRGARLRGRFELLIPGVRVDVGHTPAAAAAVAHAVSTASPDGRATLVIGASEGKDVEAIATHLATVADAAYCVRARHGANPERLAAALERARPGLPVEVCPTVGTALDAARHRAERTQHEVVVAGSLYLAAEVMEILC